MLLAESPSLNRACGVNLVYTACAAELQHLLLLLLPAAAPAPPTQQGPTHYVVVDTGHNSQGRLLHSCAGPILHTVQFTRCTLNDNRAAPWLSHQVAAAAGILRLRLHGHSTKQTVYGTTEACQAGQSVAACAQRGFTTGHPRITVGICVPHQLPITSLAHVTPRGCCREQRAPFGFGAEGSGTCAQCTPERKHRALPGTSHNGPVHHLNLSH